jgi:hypothetical protein
MQKREAKEVKVKIRIQKSNAKVIIKSVVMYLTNNSNNKKEIRNFNTLMDLNQ